MQFQTVFREKALARRAERDAIDARLQVTAPHEWLLVSGLGAVLVVLLAYGLIGRAERSLSVEAVLVRPGERVAVVAGLPGVVVDVLSEVGDTVARGQSIARVQTPVLRAPADEGSETAQRGAGDFTAHDIFTIHDIVVPHDGELVTLALAAGRRVAAGELAARIRTASAGPVEAIGFVTRAEALQLAPGMQAQVRLVAPGAGAPGILPARVERVSPRVVPPAPWLTEFGLDPPVRAHLLRAALTDPEPPPVVDGAAGTLRIVLGHRSFASLLFGNGAD